jgi:hypothetical protein
MIVLVISENFKTRANIEDRKIKLCRLSKDTSSVTLSFRTDDSYGSHYTERFGYTESDRVIAIETLKILFPNHHFEKYYLKISLGEFIDCFSEIH